MGKVYLDKKTCPLCGQEITKINFTKHLRRHEKHPETFKPQQHLDHDGLNCKYCNKKCKNKNSLIQHEIRCKDNPEHIDCKHLKACRGYTKRKGFNNSGRKA